MQSTFYDNITLNIRYGWGSFDNSTDNSLLGDTGAEGGPVAGDPIDYSTLKSWLTADALSSEGNFIHSAAAFTFELFRISG